MQVIFVPNGTGPNFQLRIRKHYVVGTALFLVLLLGAVAGTLGYRLADFTRDEPLITNHSLAKLDSEALLELRRTLDQQRERIQQTQAHLKHHFDTLGQQVGRTQAHVARLNALAKRLTEMADIDPEEFGFDSDPGIGGPEHTVEWGRVKEVEFTKLMAEIEKSLAEKEQHLVVLEAMLEGRELQAKQYPKGWPVSTGGWISSSYGLRNDPFTGRRAFHAGVDIAARSGSELRAMAEGVVIFSGRKGNYGNMIEINHGNGYHTRYGHASELLVEVGDRVERGDPVALVGSTGRSTGTHVHLEVLQNGKTVNPTRYLQASR